MQERESKSAKLSPRKERKSASAKAQKSACPALLLTGLQGAIHVSPSAAMTTWKTIPPGSIPGDKTKMQLTCYSFLFDKLTSTSLSLLCPDLKHPVQN